MSPRKRLIEAEPEEPPPSASEQLAEMADERELETVREATGFLDSFAGIANLRVTIQKTGDDGQFEHVKNLPLDSKPDEEFIAKKFGPGRYRLIVRGPKSDRYPKGYYGQTKVNIAELAPKVEANGEPGELNPFYKMLVEQQEKRADEFKSLLLALLAKDAKPAAKDNSLLETIQALAALGLIGKEQGFDPQKYAADIQAAWREGRRDADGSERPEGFAGVIHEALPIVRDGIEVMRNAQRPQPPQRAIAAPPTAPAPAGPVAPTPPVVDVATLPPWLQAVHQHLPLLRGLAFANFNPENVATDILDKLPPEAEEALRLDVAVEGWEAKTLGLLPPQLAQAHEGWTRAVLAAIKAELTAPEEVEAEPETDARD